MSTEQQRQRVSALMDGEVGRFEAAAAVTDLMRSPDLTGRWERWHLIGRALRGEPNDLAARATAERVSAAIAAHERPGRAAPGAGGLPAPRPWRPIAGAIAAGILALGLAVVLIGPVEQAWQPRGSLADARQQPTAERWQQSDPAVRARLDRLLVNHQEQVAGLGRTGVAAYAAVVGYERRP
jgi:sigma-E factor negative regulatory protein RseA